MLTNELKQELKQYTYNIKVVVENLSETPCGIVRSNSTMVWVYGKRMHSGASKSQPTSCTNVKYNIVTPMW